MEPYLLMIFVTIEQEIAIQKLFKDRRWTFKKKDEEREKVTSDMVQKNNEGKQNRNNKKDVSNFSRKSGSNKTTQSIIQDKKRVKVRKKGADAQQTPEKGTDDNTSKLEDRRSKCGSLKNQNTSKSMKVTELTNSGRKRALRSNSISKIKSQSPSNTDKEDKINSNEELGCDFIEEAEAKVVDDIDEEVDEDEIIIGGNSENVNEKNKNKVQASDCSQGNQCKETEEIESTEVKKESKGKDDIEDDGGDSSNVQYHEKGETGEAVKQLSKKKKTQLEIDLMVKSILEKDESLHLDSENKRSVCPYCKRVFLNKIPFLKHVEKHTKKAFDCPECGKSFSNIRNLKSHRFNRTKQKFFPCDICKFETISACSLRIHKKEKHPPVIDFQCHLCAKIIKTKSYLNVHLKYTHNVDDSNFKCNLCGKTCKRPSHFARHMKEHQENANHHDRKCPDCGKLFKTKLHLRSHKRVHRERKFLCDYCGKGFTTNAKLQAHDRIHTGNKPFACALCDYKSTQHGNLKLHMKVHEKKGEQEKGAKTNQESGTTAYTGTYNQQFENFMRTDGLAAVDYQKVSAANSNTVQGTVEIRDHGICVAGNSSKELPGDYMMLPSSVRNMNTMYTQTQFIDEASTVSSQETGVSKTESVRPSGANTVTYTESVPHASMKAYIQGDFVPNRGLSENDPTKIKAESDLKCAPISKLYLDPGSSANMQHPVYPQQSAVHDIMYDNVQGYSVSSCESSVNSKPDMLGSMYPQQSRTMFSNRTQVVDYTDVNQTGSVYSHASFDPSATETDYDQSKVSVYTASLDTIDYTETIQSIYDSSRPDFDHQKGPSSDSLPEKDSSESEDSDESMTQPDLSESKNVQLSYTKGMYTDSDKDLKGGYSSQVHSVYTISQDMVYNQYSQSNLALAGVPAVVTVPAQGSYDSTMYHDKNKHVSEQLTNRTGFEQKTDGTYFHGDKRLEGMYIQGSDGQPIVYSEHEMYMVADNSAFTELQRPNFENSQKEQSKG